MVQDRDWSGRQKEQVIRGWEISNSLTTLQTEEAELESKLKSLGS